MEQLLNPFDSHSLADLATHAIREFQGHIIPSISMTSQLTHRLPKALCLSLASLIACYENVFIENDWPLFIKGDKKVRFKDTLATCLVMRQIWDDYCGEEENLKNLLYQVFQQEAWWGLDLRQIEHLEETILGDLKSILNNGIHETIAQFHEK